MWPSLSTIVSSPLKAVRLHRLAQAQGSRSFSQDARISRTLITSVCGRRWHRSTHNNTHQTSRNVGSPDCLKSIPTDVLRLPLNRTNSINPLSIWMPGMSLEDGLSMIYSCLYSIATTSIDDFVTSKQRTFNKAADSIFALIAIDQWSPCIRLRENGYIEWSIWAKAAILKLVDSFQPEPACSR